MDLLTVVEQKQFLLKIEATNNEETLDDNEIASNEDDTTLALPLIKVNNKMKTRRQLSEEEGSTECSKAASQGRIILAEWAEIEVEIVGTEEEESLAKRFRSEDLRQY
ncbi:hypothetical protein AXG93_80s1020 [Marchantia polymorpha subsp. ruderalis]|uniref:Uncharacterized protein n=1 Tax=Marchantia polymorpha subsp. ruderalis TaxID=1480154 RepID=A0A176W1S7_MARPO|nr:hypothetical protein AXG93_80s1020 [Marchantia polymorpha subsp. ruderalis]